MSLPDRDGLRRLLDEDRVRTRRRIAGLQRDFDAIVDASENVNLDDEHDPEGATVAFERQQVAALLEQARRHLTELERAAARLDDGTFGDCERCGSAIAVERLRARPTAVRCVPCAAQ